jgi:hypothetical protein
MLLKPNNSSATVAVIMSGVNTPSVVRFIVEAYHQIQWLEGQLALLSPSSENYDGVQRAIQGASDELRGMICQVTAKAVGNRDWPQWILDP